MVGRIGSGDIGGGGGGGGGLPSSWLAAVGIHEWLSIAPAGNHSDPAVSPWTEHTANAFNGPASGGGVFVGGTQKGRES